MNFARARYLAVVCCCFVGVITAHAGGDLRTLRDASETDRFASGAWEIEDVVGAFFLFDRGGNERVSIDYALNSFRFGAMLYNPHGPGFLRGNVEALGEIFAGPIFNGPGTAVAGITGFLRYNFVQPGAWVVPYFQGGGGGVYTDITAEESSRAISLPVEFNLQAVAGLKFLVNRHWSFMTELGYRHISNASIHKPNYGVDQLGGNLGVAFSF
ncbi:MAG: acyloxyacyl hydrolase [Verrucomicrobiota bacterium]|nr:acyloxyacyl hydrolase [Verrucomicrobiota bacterium]